MSRQTKIMFLGCENDYLYSSICFMKKLLLIALLVCVKQLNAQSQSININQKQIEPNITFANNARLANGGHQQTQSLIALYDSIYNWKLDTSTMTWKYLSKTIGISYDVQQNQTTYLNQNWNGGSWVNRLIDTTAYNAGNKMVSQLQKTWNGTAWVDTFKIKNTYDANYNLTISLTQKLSGTVLANSILDSMTYDSKNNQTYYSKKTWNGTAWVNSLIIGNAYTYDANNNIITDQVNGSGGQTIYTYTYNSSNYVVNELRQDFVVTCSSFINTFQNKYWYNSSNKLTTFVGLACIRSGGSSCPCNWQICLEEMRGYDTHNNLTSDSVLYNICSNPSTVSSFTYDANNNLIIELLKTVYGSAFVNNNINTYTYDANNLKTSYTRKNFNSAGTKVISGDSTVYYFTAVTSINQIKNNIAKISVYPNPSNGLFVVEPNSTDKQTLQIFDVNGKLVLSQTITGKANIDASNLAEGVYNLSLINTNGVVNKRLVIVR